MTERVLRILVAEDSVFNQRLASALLEKQGHRVVVVSNGRDAVCRCESTRFDLVFMDVEMPKMDGLSAAVAIRHREQATGEHLPIIAMTAHALHDDIQQCLAAGMDAHIAKPLHASELTEVIAKCVSGPQECASGSLSASRSAPPATPAESAIDWDAALEQVGGRRALLADLVEIFFDEYPPLLAEIASAIAAGDANTVRILAHRLRSCLRYFGDNLAAGIAGRIEDLGRAGNVEQAPELLGELRESVHSLIPPLRRFAESVKSGAAEDAGPVE